MLFGVAGFVMTSFRFGDRAPTYLATPLWIPQTAMLLGAAAACFSMLRTLAADIARVRKASACPGEVVTGSPTTTRADEQDDGGRR